MQLDIILRQNKSTFQLSKHWIGKFHKVMFFSEIKKIKHNLFKKEPGPLHVIDTKDEEDLYYSNNIQAPEMPSLL